MRRTDPPSARTHANYLTLAARMYGAAGQPRHAVRCYTVALTCYGDGKWAVVEDTIYLDIASQVRRARHGKRFWWCRELAVRTRN